MDFIRNILVLSLNYEWANELKDILLKNPKLRVDVATGRNAATKCISEKTYHAIIVEDSFEEKNISMILRSLTTAKIVAPSHIIYAFVDFDFAKKIEIPSTLESKFWMYSQPMPKDELSVIIQRILMPLERPGEKKSYDREFVELLVMSSQKTLRKLGAFTSLNAGRPTLLNTMGNLDIKIRGKVIIKSPFFKGSLLISFPENTYLNVYEKMTQTRPAKIAKENEDFAGEIANIVYGQMKKVLEEQGVHLDMAIPVSDLSGPIRSQNPVFVIPIESDLGPFFVKLALNYY